MCDARHPHCPWDCREREGPVGIQWGWGWGKSRSRGLTGEEEEEEKEKEGDRTAAWASLLERSPVHRVNLGGNRMKKVFGVEK